MFEALALGIGLHKIISRKYGVVSPRVRCLLDPHSFGFDSVIVVGMEGNIRHGGSWNQGICLRWCRFSVGRGFVEEERSWIFR